MMTSQEKQNHKKILSLCEKNHWFGRNPQSFFFITQPLVPVVDKEGNWVLKEPLKLIFKPGGHGVIWKLASDEGIFDKLKEKGFQKLLIRQINNPLAGTDYGLLAFIGTGEKEQKSFGFYSCPRLLHAPEGIDVLQETVKEHFSLYCITNVEYTDFVQRGIQEKPILPNSPYSCFPSNTNILFASIDTIEGALEENLIPGAIINVKSKVNCCDAHGQASEAIVGRVESTMQNIADHIQDPDPFHLRTYIVYNRRLKTLSTAKSAYKGDGNLQGTPEGAYFDLLQNRYDLLRNYCGFNLPEMGSPEQYLQQGPSFIFHYHPALGPLYSIIAQKIQKGSLEEGSELLLEIAELKIKELSLNGSLQILATDPLGDKDSNQKIRYSNQGGKCQLFNVRVENRGIDRTQSNLYYTGKLVRNESLTILIHENGEFFAQSVVFKGNQVIEVPANTRIEAKEENGKVIFVKTLISNPSWFWSYEVGSDARIKIVN